MNSIFSQTSILLSVIVLCILLSSKVHILCAKCPSSATIRPCRCTVSAGGGVGANSTGTKRIIVCEGDDKYNIKAIFVNMTRVIPKERDRSFEELVLNNTAITELEANMFSNITFKKITIKDALSLGKISANAFGVNTNTVEEFVIVGESQVGDNRHVNELFDALSSLVVAKRVVMNRNNLKMIPSVGFGKIPGFNRKLIDLNFNQFSPTNNGFIKTIGNYAFYYLNNLRHLYLSHQRIEHIPANAFDFEKPSNHTLYIYLGNNRLNNTSFERGVLTNAKRPVHLELYWNHRLNYLEERIWRPFLLANKRNTIRLGDNPLACDCKSYWMVRDRHLFRDQLANVKCKVGPNKVFAIDLIPFDQCIHQSNAKMRQKSRNKVSNKKRV